MTYPQSGPNYGQGDAAGQYGQQQYGAQPQYGQQQYGAAPQYGQQYGGAPQSPDASAQYGQQQYGQSQPQYGAPQQYQAPKPPSQGLPHNISVILAAVVGGLGVIMLFCGFLAGYKVDSQYVDISYKVFESPFATPYTVFAAAGIAALLTLLVGATKQYVAGITALTVVAALVTIFQFATSHGDNGAGAILLLVFSVLGALASVFWLLVEVGTVKTAPAPGTAAAPAAAAPATAGYSYGEQSAAPAATTGSTYGEQSPSAGYGGYSGGASTPSTAAFGESAASPSYGESASPSYGSSAASSYGESSAPSYGSSAAPSYGESAAPSYGSYGSAPSYGDSASAGEATTYTPLPNAGAAGDGSETTAFHLSETSGAAETPGENNNK